MQSSSPTPILTRSAEKAKQSAITGEKPEGELKKLGERDAFKRNLIKDFGPIKVSTSC